MVATAGARDVADFIKEGIELTREREPSEPLNWELARDVLEEVRVRGMEAAAAAASLRWAEANRSMAEWAEEGEEEREMSRAESVPAASTWEMGRGLVEGKAILGGVAVGFVAVSGAPLSFDLLRNMMLRLEGMR